MRNYWRVIAAVAGGGGGGDVSWSARHTSHITHRYIAKYPDNPPTRRGTSGEDWGQLY